MIGYLLINSSEHLIKYSFSTKKFIKFVQSYNEFFELNNIIYILFIYILFYKINKLKSKYVIKYFKK